MSAAASVVAVGVGTLLLPAPALAKTEHTFSTSFAGTGTDALSLSNSPTNRPGIAVDNSSGPSAGDVYVADPPHNRVEKFTPSGQFILMFGADVDQTTGAGVCTAASGDTCQPGEAGTEPGALESPTFIAVDGSSGESSGDVYVVSLEPLHRTQRVQKFSSSGVFISSWATHGELQFGVEKVIAGIATDASGDLFVLNEAGPIHEVAPDGTPTGTVIASQPGPQGQLGLAVDPLGDLFEIAEPGYEVERFAPGGAMLESVAGAETPRASGLAIDPSSGDLYLGVAPYAVGQFPGSQTAVEIEHFTAACLSQPACNTPADTFGSPEPAGGDLHEATNLAVAAATGTVYVANIGKNDVAVFTEAITPEVTTGPAVEVKPTTATLNGHLEPDPEGGEVTSCAFEYVTESAFQAHGYAAAKSASCSPAAPYSEPKALTAHLSGIFGGVTYDYRLAASDPGGPRHLAGTAHGESLSFTTPSTVSSLTTEPATGVGSDLAQLHGSFEGNGEATECYFQWGTASPEEHQTPLQDAGSPAAAQTAHLSAALTGLQPETEYHYLIVCENAAGPSQGQPAQSFTTGPAVSALKTEPPEELAPTSAGLRGSFEGNGEDTHYYFEWGSEEAPKGAYEHQTPLESAGSPPLAETAHLSFDLPGLQPITTYHYRVVAENPVGTSFGADQEFKTPPAAPLIAAESVSDVHSESVLLHAKINPGGGDTTYHFEYGTEASYGTTAPIPDADAGSSQAFQSVQLQLGGLTQGTVYHWRLVAENVTQTTDGPDHTFTTFPFTPTLKDACPNALARQQTGAALLLDCRAYELVSAANTGGYNVSSDLSEGEEAPFGAYPEAQSPSRVLYSVDHGAIPGTDHPTNKGSDPYVATRTENGWSTEYVGIPANDPEASSSAPFSSVPSSADAGLGAFAFGAPGGCSPCFTGGYTGIPLRLPDGELVQGMAGSLDPGPAAKPAGHIAKDLSADGTHFVFGSTSKFEPDGAEGEVSIYDRNLLSGETHVVSKTPAGATMEEEGQEIAELDISADGSHILIGKLTGEAEGQKLYHLYMSVGDSAQTIDLTPGATAGVRFDGMTADGTKVFFSSAEHLTHEDEQHSGDDIFIWEEGQPLRLVSAGTEADASSCDPAATTLRQHWNTTGAQENCGDVAIGGQGGVASGDGTIYFLSPSLLDGSAEPADGVQNAPNLYVSRPGQALHFVATLESTLTGPLLSRHPLLRGIGTLNTPTFVAVDDSAGPSNIAIYALEGTNTIYKLAPDGSPVTAWREDGRLTNGGFPAIHGIATDPSNGDLYIAQANEVKELNAEGGFIRSFPAFVSYANGIAVDPAGNVYVYTGQYSHTIEKFSSTGKELGVIVPNITATGIAVDPSNGDLYVDNNGQTIERYSFNGAGEVISIKVIASELSQAAGLSVDASHDVYVDERGQVAEFNSSGEEISAPIGAGFLHGSTGVAADSAGNVYVDNPSHSNLAEFGPPEPSPNPRTDNPLVTDAVSEPETRHTADFQLTPSGEFAAFATTLPLDGAESGGFPALFRYDAAAESLACASCNPSGAQATGGSSLASNGSSLTEAGQVFFNSEEPLALRDSDNLTDVYEWEPAGVGTCSAESPTYSAGSGDCLGLVSTGTSPFNSKLLGVSLNGTDAYFFTRDTLAGQDENGELVKVYDARQGGGFFITPESPLCKSSDECHGAGSSPPPPPEFNPNIGSGGNEVPAAKCKQGFVEKHGACVRKPKPHRHHHKKSHKRGGHK